MRRICEIMVALDFIFRLVLCGLEDVLFNIICLNVMEGTKQFYLLMWFKKKRLETPFKGNKVNTLIKTSNCENLVLYFSEKFQKLAAFAMLFWSSLTKQSLENGLGSPNNQKYPRYTLVLKFIVTGTTAAFGYCVFFKLEILVR